MVGCLLQCEHKVTNDFALPQKFELAQWDDLEEALGVKVVGSQEASVQGSLETRHLKGHLNLSAGCPFGNNLVEQMIVMMVQK